MQHPRCELTPWKPFGLLAGKELLEGKIPASMLRCPRLRAEATPTSRIRRAEQQGLRVPRYLC